MSKIGKMFAGGLTAGLMVAAAVVYAAPGDVRTGPDLLAYCPALETGTGCPEAAASFLQFAGASDGQIVELVIKVAEEADQPTVPLSVCLDAAEGLRVLAGGVSSAERRQQILDIAEALCKDSANTGAIGEGLANENGVSDSGSGNGASSQAPSESSQSSMSESGEQTSSESSSEQNSEISSSEMISSSESSSEVSNSSSMSSSEEPTDECAGNSQPTNGNNCDNPNNSDHSSSMNSSEQPTSGDNCAGNSTLKDGQNCDNPNNS